MIQDVKIYSPDGKLKEVVPADEVKRRSWEREFEDQSAVKVYKKNKPLMFNRPPKPETLLLLDRILQVLRTPQSKNNGWTRAEISRKLKGVSIHRIRAVLDRAHLDLYGGHAVKQQVRPGSHPKAVEYYLGGEK